MCFQNALNPDALFCQPCAYSKGVCAMCGVKVLDTSGYRMSDSGVKRLGGGEKKAPEAANPAPAAVAGRRHRARHRLPPLCLMAPPW